MKKDLKINRIVRAVWPLALSAVLLAGCSNGGVPETESGAAAGPESGTVSGTESETVFEMESEAVSEPLPGTASGTENAAGETQESTAADSQAAAEEYAWHTGTFEQTWTLEDGTEAFALRLEYPVFEGDSDAEQTINAFYEEWLADRLSEYEDNPESNLHYAIQTREEIADTAAPAWSDDLTLSGVTIKKHVIAVDSDFYAYTGGAHGMPGRQLHLFDRESGKETTLAKVMKLSEAELDEKVRALFLEQYAAQPELFFADADETLNQKTGFADNARFTETGVVFYAVPYEIAPYAAGFPEVTVPYEELGIE